MINYFILSYEWVYYIPTNLIDHTKFIGFLNLRGLRKGLIHNHKRTMEDDHLTWIILSQEASQYPKKVNKYWTLIIYAKKWSGLPIFIILH